MINFLGLEDDDPLAWLLRLITPEFSPRSGWVKLIFRTSVLSWYFLLGGCSYWKRAWPGVWLVWLASRVINFVWLLRPAVIFPTCQKSCSRTGGPQRVASSPAPDNTTSVMFQYFDKRAIHGILGRRSQTKNPYTLKPNFPRQSGHFMKRYQ